MLRSGPPALLDDLRRFLDDMSFGWASARLVPGHDTVLWPDFGLLHATLRRAGEPHRLLLTLLRQGHAADGSLLRRSLPPAAWRALTGLGLLRGDARDQWRTPSMALVPVLGLMLAVSLPPHYPTARRSKQPVYLGLESLWLARALPVTGGSVLDVCAGSGVQGLLCARRGARRVVALEREPEAVAAAAFNAACNRLQDRVQVRQSDLYQALEPDESFDLIVCNPPFMPVPPGVDYPGCGDGGRDGTAVLRPLMEGLAGRLEPDGSALIFCNALGGPRHIHFNQEVLEPLARRDRLEILAAVDDKLPFDLYVQRTLAPNLAAACPELEPSHRETALEEWRADLRRQGVAHDHVYGQLLRVRPAGGGRSAGLRTTTLYEPAVTDPLMSRGLVARAGG